MYKSTMSGQERAIRGVSLGMLIILFGFGLGRLGLAGPIPKDQVLSEAKWILHLDIDAFKQTELYAHLRQRGQLQEMLNFTMSVNNEVFKLDFTRCRSLTGYGTNLDFSEGGWGGLLKMPASYRQEVLESLAKLSALQDSPLQPMPGKKAWHGYQLEDELYVFSPKSDTLVLGSEGAAEQICNLVLRKTTAQTPSFLAELPAKPASVLQLAFAGDVPDESHAPIAFNFNLNLPKGVTLPITNLAEYVQLEIIQKISGGSLALGEATNHLWSRLSLEVKTGADAGKIQTALNGLLGLARLIPSTNTHWRSVLNGLDIATHNKAIHVNFAHPIRVEGRTLYDILETEAKTAEKPGTEPIAADPKRAKMVLD